MISRVTFKGFTNQPNKAHQKLNPAQQIIPVAYSNLTADVPLDIFNF